MQWAHRLCRAFPLVALVHCGQALPATADDGAVAHEADAPVEADDTPAAPDVPQPPQDAGLDTPEVTPDRPEVALDTPEVAPDRPEVAVDRPVARDVPIARDAPAAPPCRTRVTYGNAWIHGPGHPADYDDVDGVVSWDGTCATDGSNSVATLSNGWRPYFTGHNSCVLALDYSAGCAQSAQRCATRVSYGASWIAPSNHPQRFDDVAGVVTWDGACTSGTTVRADLSNGWVPHFRGSCSLAFRYTQCGGLYANPVVDTDCPDPGVTRDGAQYVMACTGGGYRIRTSPDLVHWTTRGLIFPDGQRPAWATGDFWAPEIHRVGNRWVAYFSARHRDGSLAVGAATSNNVLGPYTDIGRPLVQVARPGVIDAHFFQASNGARYLLWKYDGNAVGARTPMYIQRLNADGVSLTGSRVELLTNDRSWEGALVEGPWMIERNGTFYLFYSANGYASARYATGVARASSPLGPFTKRPEPILVTGGAWAGPGHGSIVQGPSGDWVHVYHAWRAGRVDAAPGRIVLVDRIDFLDGWPRMIAAPSARSQPVP